MGGIVSRERPQASPRKVVRPPAVEESFAEVRHSTSPSKADAVRTDPQTVPQTERVEHCNPDLTEGVIAELIQANADNQNAKKNKKEELEDWMSRASYNVTAKEDALERHKLSMKALQTMLAGKKERTLRPRSEQNRSGSRSRGSHNRKPPAMEIYSGVPTTA